MGLQRKLGAENEELSASLEEAEAALAQEEGKNLKLTLEYAALKAATEKKASEKDEELETATLLSPRRPPDAMLPVMLPSRLTPVPMSWPSPAMKPVSLWSNPSVHENWPRA